MEVDRELGSFLREKKTDHLAWKGDVSNLLLQPGYTGEDLIVDHTQCSLGKWLYSDSVETRRAENDEFNNAVSPVYEPHRALHETAVEVKSSSNNGNLAEARALYNSDTSQYAEATLQAIDGVIGWHDQKMDSFASAGEIYADQTQPALATVQSLLGDITGTTEENIMSDRVMLELAGQTRTTVVVVGVIAVLIGIAMTPLITRSIVKPLRRVMNTVQTVAGGDLSSQIHVDQKDEVGQPAQSIADMQERLTEVVGSVKAASDNVASGSRQMSQSAEEMSQGATEQASSTEEVSSSMEEMDSNIQQNADNAQETEKIALKAAGDAEQGGKAVHQTGRGHAQHRRKDHHHRGDRAKHQPSRPQRGNRGDTSGRARKRLRCCGIRGQKARRAQPEERPGRSASSPVRPISCSQPCRFSS